MGRPTRWILIGSLLFLVAYQHFTINQVTKHADTVIHQMETEYGKRVDGLQKVIVDKKAVEEELNQAKNELSTIESALGQAQSQLSALGDRDRPLIEKINTLLESHQILEKRVVILTSEKEFLEKEFQDISALKQAIKKVKQRQVEEKKRTLKNKDRQLLVAGNRGFLIREGETTLRSRGTVEVTPAPLSPLAPLAPLAKDSQS